MLTTWGSLTCNVTSHAELAIFVSYTIGPEGRCDMLDWLKMAAVVIVLELGNSLWATNLAILPLSEEVRKATVAGNNNCW